MQQADHDRLVIAFFVFDLHISQGGTQLLVCFGRIGQIQRLAFLDQRADPVDLPPFAQLAADAFNHLVTPRVVYHFGDDGGTAGGQLVDGGDIQIGVIAHRQCAGNRRGGHHQQMRLQIRICHHLASKRQPLRHTEAMLLVDDRQGQVFKLHLVLNHRVRTDDQRCFTTGNLRQRLAPLFGFLAACQPGGGDAQRLQPADQLAKVLLRQNLGRCHQRALPAGVHAFGGRQCGDHGFAGADIALQQAVHGDVAGQVERDFATNALLRSGQLEGDDGQ